MLDILEVLGYICLGAVGVVAVIAAVVLDVVAAYYVFAGILIGGGYVLLAVGLTLIGIWFVELFGVNITEGSVGDVFMSGVFLSFFGGIWAFMVWALSRAAEVGDI